MQKAILPILTLLLLLQAPSLAGKEISISADFLNPDHYRNTFGLAMLFNGWKFHPGDNAEWAEPHFDDSDWVGLDSLQTLLDADLIEQIGFDGKGWFRLHLSVDPSLWDRPMALGYIQLGAGEIYLNGDLLKSFGKVGDSPATEEVHFVSETHMKIIPLRFAQQKHHVLAVHYSNFAMLENPNPDIPLGFALSLTELDFAIEKRAALTRWTTIYQMLAGIPASIALLHFLLYFFYRQTKENLYYALFAASLSLILFAPFQINYTTNPDLSLLSYVVFKAGLILTTLLGLRFLYYLFCDTPPKFFRLLRIVGILLILFSWTLHVNHTLVFCLATYPEMLRVVYLAIRKKQQGARIIGLGYAAFTLSCAYQVLMMLEVITPHWMFTPYVYGIILLVISMSVYLARGFARINRDLQKQLDQVKSLSDQALKQERRVQKEEIARKQLEAENALKAKELEEAHKRQEVLDELERSNRELRQTQTQLVQSERMASLVNLVAGISHEFNTPAGVISSMQNTLVRAVAKLKQALEATFPQAYQDNRQIQATFSLIANANQALETATERMVTIVRNLRNFARLDEAEFQVVDIHEGIENTLALLQIQFEDRITVTKEYGQLPPLPCAPGQLNQVFLHLLKNAVQAIEGKGEIHLTTFIADDKAHIHISDTGKGMSPQQLETIFDFHFSAGSSRVKMGFGLAISKNIIQEHKGDIRIESHLGKGSQVKITLPLQV